VIEELAYYAAPLDGIISALVHETVIREKSHLGLLKIPRCDIA
jgi:hypothetical protein